MLRHLWLKLTYGKTGLNILTLSFKKTPVKKKTLQIS